MSHAVTTELNGSLELWPLNNLGVYKKLILEVTLLRQYTSRSLNPFGPFPEDPRKRV